MLEAIAIFFVGFIPGFFSVVLVRKVQRRTRTRLYAAMNASMPRSQMPHPYLESLDYRYVEGIGYMVGEITCQFNARSSHLRCAVNPAGPCDGCSHYQSIEFHDEW